MLGSNTHFTIAVHVLTVLAVQERRTDKPISSAKIAESVDTHAAFLRQVMGHLRQANVLKTKLGPGGGSFLARPANDITLLDVYRATEGVTILHRHDINAEAPCPVASHIGELFDEVSEQIDGVIADVLNQTTIADLADRVVANFSEKAL